jgi:hypothetical protein
MIYVITANQIAVSLLFDRAFHYIVRAVSFPEQQNLWTNNFA